MQLVQTAPTAQWFDEPLCAEPSFTQECKLPSFKLMGAEIEFDTFSSSAQTNTRLSFASSCDDMYALDL